MNTAERFILGMTMTGAAFCAGFLIGEGRQQKPRPEAPRPAVVHASGAITLARTATTPPPPLDLAPGTTARTRAVTVELEPMATQRELQIDFQEGQDGTRVTISGQGVTGGQDFTIPRPPPPTVKKWTVGISYDGRTPGLWAESQHGRWVVAVAGSKNHAMIMGGIRF